MIASDASKKAMEINYLVKLDRMLRITKVRTYQNLTFFRLFRLKKDGLAPAKSGCCYLVLKELVFKYFFVILHLFHLF